MSKLDFCPAPSMEIENLRRISEIATEVSREARGVQARWGDYHSMHEAYGVMLEEMDEVWDIVKQRQSERNLDDLRNELLDVAVCAVRSILTLDKGRGRT